jgi:hypothetical protein
MEADLPVPQQITDLRISVSISASFWETTRRRIARLRSTIPPRRSRTSRIPTGPPLAAPSVPVTRLPPAARVS